MWPVAVHLIIIRDNKILLLKRFNTGVFDGYWCMPTGKIEEGESPLQAIIREAKEEVGLDINPSLATIVTANVPNIFDSSSKYKDINFFFICNNFENEPINMEPDKHDQMQWFDIDKLPNPMVDAVKQGIKQYLQSVAYGDMGF